MRANPVEWHCCEDIDIEDNSPYRKAPDNCNRHEIQERRTQAASLLRAMRRALRVLCTFKGTDEQLRLAVAHELWDAFAWNGYDLPQVSKGDA